MPEVSRTFHFGARGVNMNAYFQVAYFAARRVHRHGAVALPPVAALTAANYDADLAAAIAAAAPWQPPNPCNAGGPHVLVIAMADAHDYAAWLHLAACWKIWDLDARGQHKRFGLVRPT